MTRISSYVGILALVWISFLLSPHLFSAVTRVVCDWIDWGFLCFLHAGTLHSHDDGGMSSPYFILSGLVAFWFSIATCALGYLVEMLVIATKKRLDLRLKTGRIR